ncbi:MAG: hypothetical protein KDD60_07500, partial [Bdellovibrionales bacterium]|nr:hypothetical protein [Bdellovibrionales bacterium]
IPLQSLPHLNRVKRKALWIDFVLLVSLSIFLPARNTALAETEIDVTLLGGNLTSDLPKEAAIQVAAPNLTDSVKRDKQINGFGVFHNRNSIADGLGPEFVNNSCGQCHVKNGKGKAKLRKDMKGASAMIIKVSLRGLEENGAPRNIPGFEEQLKTQFSRGQRRRRLRKYRVLPFIRWTRVDGSYPDGTPYILRKPRLKFKLRGISSEDIVHSIRMTPGIIGPGLLEAIPEEQILAWADPDDSDNDGVSGVPNIVPDLRSQTMKVGRFGFRASNTTVEQQSAAAAYNDIGITNSLFGADEEDQLEMSDSDLEILTIYQALAGVPPARNQEDPTVILGKQLFQETGCNECHKMETSTSHPDHSELSDQLIHPFTDLLLHDMGPDLADERDEFSVTGSEWRTTPLWGIGHIADMNSDVPQRYLHDGRARDIESAILWHGGEAESARDAFKELPASDREALIAFVESL